MFSGFASILPSWPGARQPATTPVDMDLERGDESRSHMDDNRLSSVSSFRVADSYPSSIADANWQEGGLLDPRRDELDDDDDDVSTSGGGVGPPFEESVSAAPGFLSTLGRSASTPPEILRVNPPSDSFQRQLHDQDHIHSSTSSSSAASNHSYTRFFQRTLTPKRTRSTRSLGPGGVHGGLNILSPIYEPPNPELRGMQKGRVGGGSSASQDKTHAPSVHSTASTIQERITCLQGMQMNDLIPIESGLNFASLVQPPPTLQPSSSPCFRVGCAPMQNSNSPGIPQTTSKQDNQSNLLQLAPF